MKVQIIEKDGRPEWAVIPYSEYEKLVEAPEDAEDIRDIEEFHEGLQSGKEELVPSDIVDRLLDGENQVKVWREHRGLSADELAAACGITPEDLSQIEKDTANLSVETLKKIAAALNVDVDDLI